MTKVNIHEAKANLSKLIAQALNGESVIICKYNQPVIEFKPLKKVKKKRRFGSAKGKMKILDSFYDPLPEDILDAFNNPKT